MSREYTSAARRAATPDTPPPADPAGLVTWVGGDPARARQVLRELEASPVDPRDSHAAAARAELVERLLDAFPAFTLDGERFRVMGELQLLDLCELLRLAKRGARTDDPGALSALADFFKGALGAGEYERFRDHCRENCTDPDTLNDVMEGVVEDLTDRPTSRPSHSVGGPSSNGPTSRGVSHLPRRPEVGPLPSQDAPDMLSWTPQQFADWQRQQQSPLGVPASDPGPGFVSFG